MRNRVTMLAVLVLELFLACGCSHGSSASGSTGTASARQTDKPVIASFTNAYLHSGAVLVNIGAPEPGAAVYYTLDGSTPTVASPRFVAPFLVASNLTVKAVAQSGSATVSNVASATYAPNIAPGTLVWSEEFANASSANAPPDTAVWKYQTGTDTNSSVDILCAYGSNTSPCSADAPNSYVGSDGTLHLVARRTLSGAITSSRLESAGLFSFQYGRVEARIWVPEGQGIWPAFWLLGNNAATVGWPECGEMDVMERINLAGPPPAGTQKNPPAGTSDWNEGSIHGTGFTGSKLGTVYDFTGGATAAGWHTYGMLKTPGGVAYYIDDPTAPYATFTPSSVASLPGAVWPFDNGQANFLILNIAVGGSWPGPPDASTPFPAEMRVDYVHVFTN